jgi:PQQ-dependent dehydrogenase (methanol/ethanol family)
MHLAFRLVASFAILASLLVGGSLRAVVQAKPTSQTGTNVDWPLFGNTSDNTRFSTLSLINTTNVGKLGIAWTMAEGPQLFGFENDPVVVNGVLYMTTNLDQVRAVNAATGAMYWQYTPKVNFYQAIAAGGGGVPANRGVNIANGTVYLLTFDDQLIALQAATGEKIWSTTVADARLGYSEDSPPTYWNGLLLVGSAGAEGGLRGFIAAYDARTGKQVWRYYTVPAPGHDWNPAQGNHGGGTVWMPPTIDTTTGIVYFGTGNPSPDFVNTMRPGCDHWVDATLALDARTGRFLWGHSNFCPDVWDKDTSQPAMLFTVYKNGEAIRAVGEGSKGGYYWIFNARTGAVLAESPSIAPQTPNRPYPNAQGVKVCPGEAGINFGPASYSPLTQAVYTDGISSCAFIKTIPVAANASHKLGALDTGGSYQLVSYGGTVTAIDATTGRFRWHLNFPDQLMAGTMVTAGGLVFTGDDAGHFYAFDAQTGTIRWKTNLGLALGGAPIAYEVNGTEYIAVAAGGTGVSNGNGGGTLVVFKLNGAPVTPLPQVFPGLVPKNQLPSLKGLTQVNPWMYVKPKAHHVEVEVVASANANNSGFNFDGYAKGQANFIVPVGWGIEFIFSNLGTFPHSLAIASTLKVPVQEPLFGFGPAETGNAIGGIKAGVYQVMGISPLPSDAGKYYLVCKVPGHIQSGMWDYITISRTATMPSIQVTK